MCNCALTGQVHVCGEHQKRCFARFKAEKVHFQVHVLPGVGVHVQVCIARCKAMGKAARAVDEGGLNWWEQDEEYEEMEVEEAVLKKPLFPPCQLITPLS